MDAHRRPASCACTAAAAPHCRAGEIVNSGERSNRPSTPAATEPGTGGDALQSIEAHIATVGDGMQVRRALPTRQRRLVGAWCFFDHFGPATIEGTPGLRVGPHPHTGLQTVTWLVDGEVLHRDSLGSVQTIRAGQLNLMTSGRGIAHSEESPVPHPPRLHGAQLWVALPEQARQIDPAFEHHPALPRIERDSVVLTVLAGEFGGERSPATVHSPLVGLEVLVPPASSIDLPLRPEFEYGTLVMEGEWTANGEVQRPGTLFYSSPGRPRILLGSRSGARGIVLGGVPFPENVLLWWNFVARSESEILSACRDWNAGTGYFGEVRGYDGGRLVAPLPPWAPAGTASPPI